MPPKSSVESKNVAQFFAEHKSIAGFDNAGKSLYTTVREFVENSLDAAEAIEVFPEVDVNIRRVPAYEINDYYGDKKRAAEARKLSEAVQQLEDASAEASPAPTPTKGKGRRRQEKAYYCVTVTDNGSGMPHRELPQMFGKVLSGTKYKLKQSRGRFGLGAKMALLHSKMTTARPLEVFSAQEGKDFISRAVLDINMEHNEPIVLKHEKLRNDGSDDRFPENWRGSRVQVTIEGNYSAGQGQAYRWQIIRYMQRLAIITPYATLYFQYEGLEDEADKNIKLRFRRRTDHMPPRPAEVMHHPSSVDLVVVQNLIRRRNMTLVKFLRSCFSSINKGKAEDVVRGLGKRFDEDEMIQDMDIAKIKHLVKYLVDQDGWRKPNPSALSPAGEYNLYLGITKEAGPDLIATHTAEPGVFQGHAFIVEAAVSLGGNKTLEQGINIYRFANRIPLMFEEGADVITKTAKELNWGSYKMDKNQSKIGVFVSIVSTKIPFKGTGKEFITNDIPVIKDAVKSTLQRCCSQLKSAIVKEKQQLANKNRRQEIMVNVPTVCKSIFNVLEQAAEESRKRKGDNDHLEGFFKRVRDKGITRSTLESRLGAVITSFDESESSNYDAQQGKVKADANVAKFWVPLRATESRHCVHAPLAVLTLTKEAEADY